jgi:hypothetical protein
MDLIDNLMYATSFPTLGGQQINSDFVPNPVIVNPPFPFGLPGDLVYQFDVNDKMNFCAYRDSNVIEDSIVRHLFDVDDRVNYDSDGVRALNAAAPAGIDRYASFETVSSYHLLFAYLIENTRIYQIFERVIEKYAHDEELGIAENILAFNWMHNTEKLFFKNDSLRSSTIRSLIRPSFDGMRRNAYWRMFGMDLSFGDINSGSGGTINFTKAKTSNQQFIPMFEKLLTEVWHAYTNVRNTAGVNNADIEVVVELALELHELLQARRGNTAANPYSYQNLGREEYASVLLASWFSFIISDNTPVVDFLNCESSSVGERLIKIGNKVGIPAHSKSQALFEMSTPASNILRAIEQGGILDDQATMNDILGALLGNPGTLDVNINYMTDLLSLINNWERATGHRLKNPESNIRGTVTIANPVRTNGTLVAASLS